MKKILDKSKCKGRTEKSIVKHGLHRRERIRHQTVLRLFKLKTSQMHLLVASNDANYYEAATKEVKYAVA